jgi:hypothetical protein
MDVLIVGGRGEFGQFLQRDILPHICREPVSNVERETSTEERQLLIKNARHVVVATPLAGYAELACELVYRVWRAVTATLDMVGNPKLSAVFVHPIRSKRFSRD